MTHVVLLGDSIFDNAVYVPDGPSVTEQLRARLPDHWNVTLLAVDGHVTRDINAQLDRLPADATHLVVSCGGNDALRHTSVLLEPVNSVTQALELFTVIRANFRQQYRSMLAQVMATGCKVTVCTVYDCVPGLDRTMFAALAMFNEVIFREAIEAGLALIDLRLVCTDEGDYSELSPIEPSRQGGDKIATVISKILLGDSPSGAASVVYT